MESWWELGEWSGYTGNKLEPRLLTARSAVQVTMRHQGAVEGNLYSEIEDLAGKGDLPPLMKEWSHEVRVLGNESAHPKPGAPPITEEDARDIVQFLDSLLLYLYEISEADQRLPRAPEIEKAVIYG